MNGTFWDGFSQSAMLSQLLGLATALGPGAFVAVSLSVSSDVRRRRINTVPDFQVKDSTN